MVNMTKQLKRLYDGTCDVVEYEEYQRPNKSTGHREVVVMQDVPCRLSFSTINSTNPSDSASKVVQVVKLFVEPDVNIKAGSKIIVTQHGKSEEYCHSGVSTMYESHQEIVLDLFERWA